MAEDVYYYCPGGSFGDTGLIGPGGHDISHVTFCYGDPIDPTTDEGCLEIVKIWVSGSFGLLPIFPTL
jgi:hypothetical protein